LRLKILKKLRTASLNSKFTKETAKGLFRSSNQTATCYYQSNHSKVQAIR